MRKLIVILAIISIVLGLTACTQQAQGDTDPNTANNDTPKYQPHSEESIESMITWINTMNTEKFEEGRYKEFIEEVRNDGEILVPYFNEKPVFDDYRKIGGIFIFPEAKYEDKGIIYSGNKGTIRFQVTVYYFDSDFTKYAKEDLREYYKQKFFSGKELSKESREKIKKEFTEEIALQDSKATAFFTEYKESDSTVQFVQNDKYIIKIRMWKADGSEHIPIDKELLKSLRFEKVKLN